MAKPMKQGEPSPIVREKGRIYSVDSVPTYDALGSRDPEYQAYQALRFAFVAIPIIAGIDKYFNVLTSWEQYLAPAFPNLLGATPRSLMLGAGLIEVLAGIGVAFKPRIFGWVVAAWLLGIVVNLMIRGGFYDIAARDFGLCLGAYALARLAARYDHPTITPSESLAAR